MLLFIIHKHDSFKTKKPKKNSYFENSGLLFVRKLMIGSFPSAPAFYVFLLSIDWLYSTCTCTVTSARRALFFAHPLIAVSTDNLFSVGSSIGWKTRRSTHRLEIGFTVDY
jgi:hypothetical protein